MADHLTHGRKMSDYQRWEPADLEKFARQEVKLPTAEDIERIHQQAHVEGYEAGHQEGMAAGRQAGYQAGQERVQVEAERLRMLAGSLEIALRNLEQDLGQEILSLSLDIAKQMLRQALKVKPELMLSVVRGAMESLPHNTQHPHIHLHPEDAALVREMLSAELPHAGWKVVEDTRIEQGGCRIETSIAEVDATLPSRWHRIATALGQDGAWLEDSE